MSSRGSLFLAALLLVVAGAAAYYQSFSDTLVFDDFPAIRDNATLRAWWPASSVFSPPANSGVGGRPLANFTFALNYALSGADVRSYHAVNLLFHLSSSLLLFGILRRTLVGAAEASVALGAAFLWTVHPLTTSSVTYLSQRTELLMAFFYLLTLYSFIRARGGHVRRWSFVSIAACALGMMSKEVMVTAPVVVLLYDRTFIAGTFRTAWRERRGYYVGLAATWIVLGYLLTTGLNQRSVGYGLGVSALDYALTECRAILLYLRLALWPAPLVFDYGPIYSGNTAAVLVVAALLALTIMALQRRSIAGFAAGCFFLLLAPTSSVVPVADQPIAENRMYLPLAVVLSLGLAVLQRAFGHRSRGALPVAAAGLCLVTFMRNLDYRSEATLWADTVSKRPQSSRARYNYGIVLLDAGRAADSVPQFEAAIRLKPADAKAHNSLGNALLALNRLPEAIVQFAAAVERDPNHSGAWHNYGSALLRQGDATGAIERFQQALRLKPGDPAIHLALGNAQFHLDHAAKAIEHYETALRIDPTLADAHYNSGSACLELGRIAEAVAHFAAAAGLKPTDAEIRNNYGAALLRAGRPREAITQFENAVRLKPDYSDARDNLVIARREIERVK